MYSNYTTSIKASKNIQMFFVLFSFDIFTYSLVSVFSSTGTGHFKRIFSRKVCIIYSWFYTNMSRNESEAIVENDGREGCFMVRDSSRPGVYTLTILVRAAGLVILAFLHRLYVLLWFCFIMCL